MQKMMYQLKKDKLRGMDLDLLRKENSELVEKYEFWRTHSKEKPGYGQFILLMMPYLDTYQGESVMVVPLRIGRPSDIDGKRILWGMKGIGYIVINYGTLVVLDFSTKEEIDAVITRRWENKDFDGYKEI